MTEQTYPIGCVVNYRWLDDEDKNNTGVGYVSFETNDFPDGVEMDEAHTPEGICDSNVLYYHDENETVADNFLDFIRQMGSGGITYNGFGIVSILNFTFSANEVN